MNWRDGTGSSLLALAVFACGCGSPGSQYRPPDPPTVVVTSPISIEVVPFVEANGETEAVGRAVVRARASGILEKVFFVPAQEVEADAPLFLIEKREYVAARDSAKAELDAAAAAIVVAEATRERALGQLAVAKAEIAVAEPEYQRVEQLKDSGTVTRSQLEAARGKRDTARASKIAADAAIQEADAAIQSATAQRERAAAALELAEIDLEHTTVVAPTGGFVSKADVKKGNLVDVGEPLATVVDWDPIYVNFSLSERSVLRLQRAANEKVDEEQPDDTSTAGDEDEPDGEPKWARIPVLLRRELDDGFSFRGRLNYVDLEGVDQTTGTLAFRGILPNPDKQLLPGLFVRVRLPTSKKKAKLVLVPERAVRKDQTGSFLLLIGKEDRVERKPIETGDRYGDLIAVEGVDLEATVIVEGLQRARPGERVTVGSRSTLSPPVVPEFDFELDDIPVAEPRDPVEPSPDDGERGGVPEQGDAPAPPTEDASDPGTGPEGLDDAGEAGQG